MQGEDKIPEHYKPFNQKWKELHPNYKLIVWDETKIRAEIQKHLPDFLSIWDSINIMIVKVDIAKIVLLWIYGGFYADMVNFFLLLTKRICNL